MTAEEMETKLSEITKQLCNIEAAALAVAEMPDNERDLFKSWPGERKKEFLAADEKTRTQMLAAAKPPEIPDDVKKRFDDLAKRLADAETRANAAEELAKRESEQRRLQELSKQAETEFPGIPGTPDEKGRILKSLDKLSAEERESVLKVFRSGNECLVKSLGGERGSRDHNGDGDAWTKIETLAKKMAAEKNISQAEAVSKVLDEHVDLATEYWKETTNR